LRATKSSVRNGSAPTPRPRSGSSSTASRLPRRARLTRKNPRSSRNTPRKPLRHPPRASLLPQGDPWPATSNWQRCGRRSPAASRFRTLSLMLRVGLTGGIGSGKSMVAARLAEHGAWVIDSDRIAHQVLGSGSAGLRAVVEVFGEEVLTEDGMLDRP